MFNKKRIVVFTVFILFMFLFITFAGGTPQNQAIATRMVTFIDGYNSEVISEQRVIVGEDAEVPEDPRHNQMVFAGWYLDEDRETRVTDFSNVVSNVTVVALYGADLNGNGVIDDNDERYTVRFVDAFDNSVINTQEVLVGMDAVAPQAPVHAGMTFTGWSRGFTNVQANITVNSVLRQDNQLAVINRYIVTFVDGDTDEVIAEVLVQEGLTAETPVAPRHENRVFVRWDGNYTNVAGASRVVAVYADDVNNNGTPDDVEERFGVTYYSEANGEVVLGGSYLTGTNYTVRENVFEKDKQVFIGWSTEPVNEVIKTKEQADSLTLVQPNTRLTMGSEAVQYYAVWAENKNALYEEENGIDPTPDYMEERYTLSVDYKDAKGNNYVNKDSYKIENLLVGEEVEIEVPVNDHYKIKVDTSLLVVTNQLTDKIVGTMPNKDVTVTATYTAITDNNDNGIADDDEDHYTLTINYVNAKGGKVFEAVTKSLVEGEKYIVASPEKEHYTVDKAKVEGTMGKADVTETVTYKAGTDNNDNGIDDNDEDHYTLTINYVNTKGGKVFEPVTKSLVEGEKYSVASPEKEHYTVDKAKVEGTMGKADVTETVVYTAGTDNNDNGIDDNDEDHYTLTINYVNNKGGKVFEPVTKSLVEGEKYSIESPKKDNYTIDKAKVEGTMGKANVTETVTYTAGTDNNDNGIDDNDEDHYTLTINYVNNKGGKVFEPVTKSLVEGEKYSVTSPEKTHYTIDKAVVSGTMGKEDTAVTVTYTPEIDNNNNGTDDRDEDHYTLTINYLNNKGGKVFEPVTKSLVEGEKYSVTSPEKEHYTIDKAVVSGTMGKEDTAVTVTYTPEIDNNNNGTDDRDEDHYTLTINYVNTKGGKVFESVTKSLVEGEKYSIESPKKDHYTIDKAKVEGTMGKADVTETVVYTAGTDNNDNGIDDNDETHYTLTINYVNTKGGKVFEPVTKSLVEGEKYSVASPEKEHYTVDKAKVEGTMGKAAITETVTYTAGTDNNNNGIDDNDETHYTLTINYVNAKGGKVFEPVTKSLVEGEKYSVESPEKEHYTVDKDVVSGTMGKAAITETVTYTAGTDNNNNGIDDNDETHYTLTINYVNNKGGNVFDPVTRSLVEGESYSVTSPEKLYYTIDKTVVSGTMGKEAITETVVYTPERDKNNNGVADQEEKYTVKFIDWDGTVLSTQQVMYGDAAVAPENPTRANTQEYKYTFNEWSQNYEYITSDLEVYADYNEEKQKYTVTFYDYYGNKVKEDTVEYGTTTVTAPSVPKDIKIGENVVTFKAWDTDAYKNVVDTTEVHAKYVMLKASTAVLFRLPDNYIRQEDGGSDNRQFTRYTGDPIAIKDDEEGNLARIMSANKKSGEEKLAVGKENIRKYLTEDALKIVERDDIDTYVLKYGYGDKLWHLDYQINSKDIAVYRSGDKRLKIVSSHNITSIDRYQDRSLVESVNVTSLGNGVYMSGEFSRNIENSGSGWLTSRYYVVHYDDGQTETVYWER